MRPRTRLPLLSAAVLLVLPLIIAGSARAAEPEVPEKPAWRCLPAETAVALRVPGGRRFVNALRERTRFGSVVFSEQRRDRLAEILKDQSPEQWDRLLGKLDEYNLGFDDLPRFFDGSCGLGLVLEPRSDREPMMMALGWAEPGEDLAARLMDAIRKAVAETQDSEHPIRRLDEELGGQSTLHLTLPVLGPKEAPQQTELPENFAEMSDEQRREFFEQQQQARDTELVELDRRHLLLSRVGGRLLMGATFSQSKDRVRNRLQKGEAVDWPALTSIETARGVFARYLRSQEGDDGGFARSVLQTPGLREALPEGLPLVELNASSETLTRLTEAYAETEAGEGLDEMMRGLRKLGLDRMNAAAMRLSLDGRRLRGNMFLSAPSPREGIPALLEQPNVEPRPASWVASDVLGYAHVSAELGELYRRIKEMVIAEVGDSARQVYEQVESSFQQQIQAGPGDVLAGLGRHHRILSFETRMVTVEMPEFEPQGPNQQPQRKMVEREMPQSRLAYVWRVRNEAVWKRVLQFIGRFAPMTQGALQRAEEQGFTGWRMERGPFNGGLFLGQGYLVFALGEGVPQRVLSMLSNPPEGEGALVGSEVYRRARELTGLRPGMFFSVSDMDRSVRNARRTLMHLIEGEGHAANPLGLMLGGAMAGGPAGGAQAEQRRKALRELIPTEEELENSFTASVAQGYLNEHGFVSESVVELLPPEE